MKAFSKSRGWFFEVDFDGQTICSLLKLACALLAFGWLPWQSQLPTCTAGARCGFSPAVRVHGKNHARYKDAYFEQPTPRFRQNVFQDIHCADIHSSLLSSVVAWASLWGISTVATYSRHHMRGRHCSPDSVESDYDHTLLFRGAQFGFCMRAVIIRGFYDPDCGHIAGGRKRTSVFSKERTKPSFPGRGHTSNAISSHPL